MPHVPDWMDRKRVADGETNLLHDLANDIPVDTTVDNKKIDAELRYKLAHCADRVPVSIASSSRQKAVLWKELAKQAIRMSKLTKLNHEKARALLSRLSSEF